MSARKRTNSAKPEMLRLSRAKVEEYCRCPRCFWLTSKGVRQPPLGMASLQNAVDSLLKREFDSYRASGTQHPIMKEFGIEAVPLRHDLFESWRGSSKDGLFFDHRELGVKAFGYVDDIWMTPGGGFIVVDYKTTAKAGAEGESLLGNWRFSYFRQIEFYQWLLMKNRYLVEPTGYFLVCNANSLDEKFGGRLSFKMSLVPHKGKTGWVEGTLAAMKSCLAMESAPIGHPRCIYCNYREAASELL